MEVGTRLRCPTGSAIVGLPRPRLGSRDWVRAARAGVLVVV
jgi:hypothetical protein